MTNPNPNQVLYPFGGGTDNPGEDTSKPGGPTNVAAVETGAPPTAVLHPHIPPTLPQAQTDTVLAPGVQAVPIVGTGIESAVDAGTETGGGVDPLTGGPRQSGQDEVLGETETTSGVSPAAFPEPTP